MVVDGRVGNVRGVWLGWVLLCVAAIVGDFWAVLGERACWVWRFVGFVCGICFRV